MIDSAKRLLLGVNYQSTKIYIEVNAKIKWFKNIPKENSIVSNHSYRNNRIKALSPKISSNYNSLKNNFFSSSVENELFMIKTPPNNYIKNNELFKDYSLNNSKIPHVDKKKSLSFVSSNEFSINNNSQLLSNKDMTNLHNNFLLSAPIDIGIDYRIKEQSSLFLSKYSQQDLLFTEQSTMKTMIIDAFNYVKTAKSVYRDKFNVNKKLKDELYNIKEKYRHIIKIKDALNDDNEKRHLTLMIQVKLNKGNDITNIALKSKQKEISFTRDILNIVHNEKIDIEKIKEKNILNKMTTDEKSIVLLLTIKSIITTYGKITMLAPFEFQSKLNRILSLYDIKEGAFKLPKVENVNQPCTIINKITEQDNEDDEDEKNEEDIKKVLILNNYGDRNIVFHQSGNEYNNLNIIAVKAISSYEEVKIKQNDEYKYLKQFIQKQNHKTESLNPLSKNKKKKII